MAIPVADDPVSWRVLAVLRPPASQCGLAFCYRSAEDIFVVAVVVAELKFRNAWYPNLKTQKEAPGEADEAEEAHDAQGDTDKASVA